MTATFSKTKLSGSTDGMGIDVSATAIGSGVTIHTASAGTTAGLGDNITLFAANMHTSAVQLVIGWGATADPDLIYLDIPPKAGLILVVADLFLHNGKIVKASAASASKITIHGYVNLIS